jgi:hypothetical protein
VFDEPVRLLTDDLAFLHCQLELLMYMLAHDPNIESMQRASQEIDKSRLADVIDDINRALGENE